MELINEIAFVEVSMYLGKDAAPDKHGEDPLYMSLMAGTMPNRNILNGTIAKREGIVAGNRYLVHIVEGKLDKEYGRQFGVTMLEEVVGTAGLFEAKVALGKAETLFIPKAGVAVEAGVLEELEASEAPEE